MLTRQEAGRTSLHTAVTPLTLLNRSFAMASLGCECSQLVQATRMQSHLVEVLGLSMKVTSCEGLLSSRN